MDTTAEVIPSSDLSGRTYCLQCCGEYLTARDSGVPPDQRPPIQLAVTWAPSWQSQVINGQMMMACIVLPSCFDHLGNRQKSAEEIAAGRGLILGGGG